MARRARLGTAGLAEAASRALAEVLPAEAAGLPTTWPEELSVHVPTASELDRDPAGALDAAMATASSAMAAGATVVTRTLAIGHGIARTVPRRVVVPDVDVLARLAAPDGTRLLGLARSRAAAIRASLPDAAPDLVARVLSETRSWSPRDFDALVRASAWFASNDAGGLRPRQVPVTGASGKWLEAHEATVALLAGLPALGLARDPATVAYRLLDPAWHASPAAWGLAVEGQDPCLPYRPSRVIVLENRSTWVGMPPVQDAVAVYGAGWAVVGAAPALAWAVRTDLAYWGDMDADGLEILDALRARLPRVRSLLMDVDAFRRYEPTCGTSHDERGRSLAGHARHGLTRLTSGERALYLGLTGEPGWGMSLRVEQERIPYADAVAAMLSASGDVGRGPEEGAA